MSAMVDTVQRRRRGRTSLSGQMDRASRERHDRIARHRIDRILAMLTDEALVTAAALDIDSAEGMRFECGFADRVWDHPEIRARIRQLADRGVDVDLVEQETQIAGRRFSRPQILVR
ncbi:MAG: hypothetical protein GVY13_05680, partial [Alphaproteobacteria bacterium]|nr:hypothetical protein [Alphaproteobacteria bacterium]